MSLRTFLAALAVVVAFTAVGTDAKGLATAVLGNKFRSYYWSTCPASDGVEHFWHHGFQSILFCPSVLEFSRRNPVLDSAPALACLRPVATIMGLGSSTTSLTGAAAGSLNCTAVAEAIIEGYWCTVATKNFSNFATANGLSSLTQAQCSAAAAWTMVDEAVKFVSETEPEISMDCTNGDDFAKMTACDSDYGNINRFFPTFPRHGCINYLNLKCTRCLPLISETVVTQPYEFLLIPGIKLVAIKLFELFVLFHIMNWVRERMTRALRDREAPEEETHTPEFRQYFIKEVLNNGEFKLRPHMTLQHAKGKDFVLAIKEHFEEKGAEPLDKEQREEYLDDDTGISRQEASFSQKQCLAEVKKAMKEAGLEVTDDDDDQRDNEMVDWFYFNICQYGARRPLSKYNDVVNATVKEQLALLERRHVLKLRQATEEEEEEAALYDIKDEKKRKEAVRNLRELRRKEARAVGGAFMGEIDNDLAQTRETEQFVDVTMRCANPGSKPVDYTFFTSEKRQVKALIEELSHAIARNRRASVSTDRNEPTAIPQRPCIEVFEFDKLTPVDPDMRLDLLKATSPTLNFRYVVDAEHYHTTQARKKLNLSTFASVEDELDHVRADFIHKIKFADSRFTSEDMETDTKEALDRVLDDRFGTKIRQIIRSACGPEYIYECDLTTTERYELRDSIRQLEGPEENRLVHGTDPKPSYDKCYDFITRYTTWDKEHSRFGVLKCYDEEENAKAKRVLSAMYTASKDRLLADGSDELDDTVVAEIGKRFRTKMEDVSRLVPVMFIDEQVWKAIFAVNSIVVLISELYAIVFLYMCIEAGLDDPYTSGWQRYENIFFRFVNSGSPPSLLASSVINLFTNRQARFEFWLFKVTDFAAIIIATILLLPPFVTHIIPGTVLYIWVVLPAVIVLVLPIAVFLAIYVVLRRRWVMDRDDPEAVILSRKRKLKLILTAGLLFTAFASLVVVVTLLQSTYNYATIFYRRDELRVDYHKVPEYEYLTRAAVCYFERALDSTANVLQLVSSFVG